MRELDQPFDAVNNEQFVINFYKNVRPIDEATAEGIYPRVSRFFIQPVAMTTKTLAWTVQWFLDDVPIAGAHALTFDAASLPEAQHERVLSVRVADISPYVRDEDALEYLLSEERFWFLAPDVIPALLPSSHGD
jgi:hypothetical protein